MFNKKIFLSILAVLLIFISCNKKYEYSDKQNLNNIIYAGARSSAYGIRPFPNPIVWEKGIKEIDNLFDANAVPAALWIVGVMGRNSTHCRLEFPVDTSLYENIECLQYDKHERFLSHFDSSGIKVFLQVESAIAEVDDLIKIVFDQYAHHPCVVGFGVDGEWHKYSKKNDWGTPIDDASAERWEKLVKSYNPKYQLFLKHWDRKWMPKNYWGDIIFVSDSQQFKSKNHMISEFADYWGKYFYPNTVFYQIGYSADKKYWETLTNPIKEWGITIANTQKQKTGIFWVDFTLKSTVEAFKKDGDFIIGTKVYDYEGEIDGLFSEFKSARINTLIASEKLNANSQFCQFVKENNMKRFLIFPTFYAPEYLKDYPDHYAIQNDGNIAKDEWVEFACPSRPDFRELRIEQMKQKIRDYQPDGISIDFIRHFCLLGKNISRKKCGVITEYLLL